MIFQRMETMRSSAMLAMPTMLASLLAPASLADEAITSLARDMARTVGKDAFVRQQTAIMARPDSRSLLPAIRCPTLVLCGAEDSVTPLDRHQEMAAAIEGARLEQVDGAGHLTPLEQPEVVTAALARWLAPL